MRQLLRLFVVLMLVSGCSAKNNGTQSISIDTPEGKVMAHGVEQPSTPQQVTALSGNELTSITMPATRAGEFLRAYLPNSNPENLKDYDRAFREWQTSQSPKHSSEEVVQILGAYLGNRCVADLDMEWVKVNDEYGTDYAVRSKTQDVMAFPFSTVQKRVDDREYDFLNGVYYLLKQKLEAGDSKLLVPAPAK